MTETTARPVQPFPQQRTCPYDPPSGLLSLRGEGPVHDVVLYDGQPARLVSSYSLARQLLADPRLSVDRAAPGFPIMSPRLRAAIAQKLVLIGMDPPVHDVHRRLVNREFSLKHVRARREEIQKIVDDAVDDVIAHGPPADLVRLFAVPIPSMVISRVLGVPYDDHEYFQDAARQMVLAGKPEEAQQAGLRLSRYFAELVARPGHDAEAGLLHRLVAEGTMSEQEIVQMGLVVLVAGHETSAEMIALGVLTLLEHPDQLAAVRADPAKTTAAVEELLRLLAVTDTAGLRVATADIEADGVLIRAGEGVIISGSLANRDPAVHTDPDQLDIDRPSHRHHLGFGYGIHQCLGQSLARLELEIAFTTLFRRLPGLRLARPIEELPVRDAGTVQGIKELPVTW
ncbi:cytochrome P450 [Lentzea kentuckyensis]|uniref:cytochrome P450 n=1 Tax=Lentzea kentuckyensis TaxID=360086 RepID=UPI000A3A7FF9|nr:cytochrome P450 [Lentzea kentuckyensis]